MEVGARFDGDGVYNGATGDTVRWKMIFFCRKRKTCRYSGFNIVSTQSWFPDQAFGNTVAVSINRSFNKCMGIFTLTMQQM